jgi:putative hemolysin
MVYVACVVLLLCAGVSFFFALAEASLFSLGKWRLRQLAEQRPDGSRVVQQLLEAPQDLLATIALGNTFSYALMIAILISGHAQWDNTDWGRSAWGRYDIWVALAGLLVLILFGCEIIPKTLAVRDPETWAVRVGPVMAALTRLFLPLRRLVQWLNGAILAAAARRAITPTAGLTDDEYRELVDLAFQQGTLAAAEKEIILQIIALDRRTAGEAMKPRARLVAVSDDATREEMIAAARQHKHRRLPIYDESPDTIVGVLNTRALLLDPEMDLADAIEFPSFVPASMNLMQLFKSLQRQQRGLAIVLDEFGGTAGVVTMEDILEEIVGDIRGEGEAEGFVMEKLHEGRWRVNGTMRLEDFQREYPELGDYPGVETMGGLMVALKEVVPAAGEKVGFRGLQLTVTAADERRVRELLAERVSPAKGKGGAA